MKKFFRKIKTKLSPLVLIPIVFVALILVGGYFLFFAGDDKKDNATAGTPNGGQAKTTTSDNPTGTLDKPPPPVIKPDPTAGKQFTIDSDRDEKAYAVVQATGVIKTPQTISMRVGAAPKQPVTVNWNIVCLEPTEGTQSSDATFTATPPFERQLKLPVAAASAVTCTATANAQLTHAGRGRIKVFLVGTRRAAQ
ncbi:MAG: hypothetical protein QOG15_2438 [Solirubrobacteraceae bacterium]|nr:hypothetical protein [Solirubrobacteraceae bacterium]